MLQQQRSSSSSGSSGGLSDTWRIYMNCAFPGPTATRCCCCFIPSGLGIATENDVFFVPHTRIFQTLQHASVCCCASGLRVRYIVSWMVWSAGPGGIVQPTRTQLKHHVLARLKRLLHGEVFEPLTDSLANERGSAAVSRSDGGLFAVSVCDGNLLMRTKSGLWIRNHHHHQRRRRHLFTQTEISKRTLKIRERVQNYR